MPSIPYLACTIFGFVLLLPLSAENPPPGIPVPQSTRIELENGVAKLGSAIESLRADLADQPALLELIPDVAIYYNAVRYALIHNQFYRDEKPNEFDIAVSFLEKGLLRAKSLQNGDAPWTRQTGLVVRGYVSDIDSSVQPYGLEIPDTYNFGSSNPHRLDIWYHGRGNTLSEIKFIHDRENQTGKFHSPDTIVLHPFGRYCNANKFAGETDTFEAIESVKNRYRVDPNRMAVRGFSMGGAATWHMAAHYAGRWVAAAPGAGFAETALYADVLNKTPVPTWYELKLHSSYDATKYARNLFHCPTIAYSGSEDKQKQAADIMDEYMKAEGLELLHIIGPGMGHKYDDRSIKIINDQVADWARKPIDPFPHEIRFTTYTLRYNTMHWLTVDGLDEHWKRSDVTASIVDGKRIAIETRNVQALSLNLSPELLSLKSGSRLNVEIDKQKVPSRVSNSQGNSRLSLYKNDGKWTTEKPSQSPLLLKKHGLQGPIDDAFMNRFLFVNPTSKGSSKAFDAWVDRERKEAVTQWWRQFRGEVLEKADHEVTQDDIENCHLVLWGDPFSNQILARIKAQLPFQWNANEFEINNQAYSTDRHAPLMIFPNPLNPNRYIVINTSFTFSKFSGGSNSLQVPKLPDWAVIDLNATQDSQYPIGVIDADFFDEHWRFKKK